jgi:hypothetical protein
VYVFRKFNDIGRRPNCKVFGQRPGASLAIRFGNTALWLIDVVCVGHLNQVTPES